MKTRNPVAGNAYRYNKAKVFAPKKGQGVKLRQDISFDEYQDEDFDENK